MGYPYRCSRCRARRTLPRRLDQYAREPKCKACGYTRFYVDRSRLEREPCRCDGGLMGRTGGIPHRPGAACCEHNPRHVINRAKRAGASAEDLMDIMIDMAWEDDGGTPAPDECPF